MPEPGVIPDRVLSGRVLNNIYQIGAAIEHGAFADIYDGAEVSTGEQVAIKILHPRLAEDFKTRAMFLEEARTLTRLSQPGLPRYRTCAQDPESGLTYIVTELMGPTLSAHLATLKPADREILAFAKRLALALAAAHRSGLVHCRLTPDGIRVPGGRLADATIFNFGSTKYLQSAGKSPSNVPASDQAYCAPEQRRYDDDNPAIGPWTDVYSLALVALALAGGEGVKRTREVPDLSPLPQRLHPMFAKMLAPDPGTRFQSMDEVLAALDALPQDLSPPADVPAPKPQAESAPAPVLRAVSPTPAPPVASAPLAPRVVSPTPAPPVPLAPPAARVVSPTPASPASAALVQRAISPTPAPPVASAPPAPRPVSATPAPPVAPTPRVSPTPAPPIASAFEASAFAKPTADKPAAPAPRVVSPTPAPTVAPAAPVQRVVSTAPASPASAALVQRAASATPSPPAPAAPAPRVSATPAPPVPPTPRAPSATPAPPIASAPSAARPASATPAVPVTPTPRAASPTPASPVASAAPAARPVSPTPAPSAAPQPRAATAAAPAAGLSAVAAGAAVAAASAVSAAAAEAAERSRQIALAEVRASNRSGSVRTVGLAGIGVAAFLLGAGFWLVHTTVLPSAPPNVARAARPVGTVY